MKIKNYEEIPLKDKLFNKIMIYYSTIWKDKIEDGICENWINNFHDDKEQINALYLLSKFMYFGNIELREMLKSIYRDLYKYPIIKQIRKNNDDIIELNRINEYFNEELNKTRFLGIGNPSESGIHLLYYFRQENSLSKEYFINTHEIFNSIMIEDMDAKGNKRKYLKTELSNNNINKFIFIDDFCGSGDQAISYSTSIVEKIKSINTNIEVNYFVLFSTKNGLNEVLTKTKFDNAKAIFTLDDTFQCFTKNSRYYFNTGNSIIDKAFTKKFCEAYGKNLFINPLGYKNGQFLLGLFHNTPDNTLPIFWSNNNNWKPIFKRYHKIY